MAISLYNSLISGVDRSIICLKFSSLDFILTYKQLDISKLFRIFVSENMQLQNYNSTESAVMSQGG